MNAFAFSMRIGVIGEPPAIPNRTILRREIERQIDLLIAALDDMDGDPEREDDGTGELSLGWPNDHRSSIGVAVDDREQDDDEEPTLGFHEGSRHDGTFPDDQPTGFRRYRHERDYEGVPCGD